MLINKMKYMKDLTNQERHIVEYILQNPETVFKVTANDLAKLTYTSSSTIVRLCKKLGTKGFPDFQLQFALEYKESNLKNQLQNAGVGDNKEFLDKVDSIPFIYEEALIQTRKRFNVEDLVEIINWLKDASRIEVYGVDANYYIAQQACAKWNEIGIHAGAYNSVNYHLLNNTKNNSKTVSFVISHTGTNKAIIDIAKTLKSFKRKVVAISGSKHNDLAKLADKNIQSYYNDENPHLIKIFNVITTQYIFDVLYLGILEE
ncbi:MurR/RpiR family transcriptional regulator [Neobacillus sp. 179-J 1A1 HS]|uniref:MurR/RpiR family transcriptional regulator n=1 Tax=Neobacillus driksii TaxID=3035913 RepID=UPI0035BC3938